MNAEQNLSIAQAHETLKLPQATLRELTEAVRFLEKNQGHKQASIGISASATIDLIDIYLKRYALQHGLSLSVQSGNFDDPIGDVDRFLEKGIEQMLLFPFFDLLLPAFEAQLPNLSESMLKAKLNEVRARYQFVFSKAASFQNVVICTFHEMSPALPYSGKSKTETIIESFNQILFEEASAYRNIHFIDTKEIISLIGKQNAFDPRFYYRNKAPYTGAFFNELAKRIILSSRAFGAYYYKALVLDCDNTLWGGIIGEDLLTGIKLSAHDYPGNIYWRMQHEFSMLEKQGILLCLCSKNNPEDVNEALAKHSSMVLKDENIILKKVNWLDKTINIRKIAQELNIGLDSLIFLDDSEFECKAVREQLPMVKTIQVPKNLTDYPKLVEEIRALFLAGGISAESQPKTKQYKQRAQIESDTAKFNSQEEYLSSLEIYVHLSKNKPEHIARISELSMKSNQFNLTTRRYSETEIKALMQSEEHDVYALHVADRFSDAGLTGVMIVHYQDNQVNIKNFLMSCRVIGRGAETAFWATLIEEFKKREKTSLTATFIPSKKNAQVADFYDRLGLNPVSEKPDGAREYEITLNEFSPSPIPWIKINKDYK